MALTPWRLLLATRAGAVLEELDAAYDVRGGSQVLNGIGEVSFSIPALDSKAKLLKTAELEIQQWRDDLLWFAGPVTVLDQTGPVVSVKAQDIGWYLNRRNFGPVEQQFLGNPDFAAGASGWTAVNCGFTVNGDYKIRGANTAKLTSGTFAADAFIYRSFVSPLNVNAGTVYTASYWYQVVTYTGPAWEERGLYIVTFDNLGNEIEARFVPIRASDPVGSWQRLEVQSAPIPQGVSNWVVQVQLYAPQGEIRWGGGAVRVDEHVFSDVGGTDATEMVRRIVDYAQNSAYKSPLNLATNTPASGTKVERNYFYRDNGNIWSSLTDYPDQGLCDIGVTLDSQTVRTFRTWSPRRGTAKPELAITTEDLLDIRYTEDANQTATAARRMGQGDGPDREIGFAVDAAGLGGLILDSVESAPPETSLDGLQALAEADLARTKLGVKLPAPVVDFSRYAGAGLAPGDTIPVNVDYGLAQLAGNYRVVSLDPDPETDTVAINLNLP